MLSHVSLALLHLALGKAVSVLTLFIWARYLLVVLLPLTVYGSARLLMLPRPVAVASALVSPLIATNGFSDWSMERTCGEAADCLPRRSLCTCF